jgi:glutaredoxin-like protein NrdH
MIRLYTKPNCVQCDQTKKFLDRNNLEYVSVDISSDQEAYNKAVEMGFTSAPIVVTDNGAWSGFKPDRLQELL